MYKDGPVDNFSCEILTCHILVGRMPEMQEQFPVMSMDGRYAGNAGQFPVMSTDGRYAGNAGAVSGYVHGWTVCRKRRSSFRLCPRMDGMQETQEQFPVTWGFVALSSPCSSRALAKPLVATKQHQKKSPILSDGAFMSTDGRYFARRQEAGAILE